MTERNYSRQAAQALRAYVKRGRDGESLLSAGQVEEFLELMRWRSAAFHNFRVADAMAKDLGSDVSVDPEIRTLWIEASAIDGRLSSLISGARDEAKLLVDKLSTARPKIRAYKSKQGSNPSFAKSV